MTSQNFSDDFPTISKLAVEHSFHNCGLTDFACGFKTGKNAEREEYGLRPLQIQQIIEKARQDTIEEIQLNGEWAKKGSMLILDKDCLVITKDKITKLTNRKEAK